MIKIAAQTPLDQTPVAIVVIGIMEDNHARTVAVGLDPEHAEIIRSAVDEIEASLMAKGSCK